MNKISTLITACVCVLLTASLMAQDKPSERRYISLARSVGGLPFSDAVLINNTLYISGRLGLDPKTRMPPKDAEEEVKLLLDGFKAVLAESRMTMDHLVYVHVFCPDLSLYDKFNGVYRTYFQKDFPARAFIGSGPLLRGARFEMQGIAVK